MRQSSKRLTSMIIALVFLVAAFLIFFDLVQPTYGDLEQLKGTELSTQNLLVNERQVMTQAQSLLAQYESNTQSQTTLALAMPSGPDIAGALAQVYGIAADNNINVQGLTFTTPTVNLQNPTGGTQSGGGTSTLSLSQIVKPVGTYSIQITAAGSYESIKSFLSQLETNIRIFDVTAISVQGAPVTAGPKGALLSSDFFTFNVTVATYYQLP